MKKIAFITDSHLDEGLYEEIGVDAHERLEVIFKDVKQRGIKHIIFGGDIGNASAHPWIFDKL